MYKVKFANSSQTLEVLLGYISTNNYTIIAVTQYRTTYTIVYKESV